MTANSSYQRPPTDYFEVNGTRVTVLDGAGILAQANAGVVQIVQQAELWAPFSSLSASVTTGSSNGEPVYEFRAKAGRYRAAQGVRQAFLAGVFSASSLLTALAIEEGTQRYLRRRAAKSGVTLPDQPLAPRFSALDATFMDIAGGSAKVHLIDDHTSGRITFSTIVSRSVGETEAKRILNEFLLCVVSQLAERSDATVRPPGKFLFSHYKDGKWLELSEDGARFTDIGGLQAVVEELRFVAGSFRDPSTVRAWGSRRPQGVLFYGPPGTGKTMLVTALANEIGAELVTIDSSNILDKWVGSSEKKIKKIFRDARARTSPTILFFDEFDAVINSTDDPSHQVLNSVAGIFKVEMTALTKTNPNILVAAATNYLHERVDAALTRSGRFDVKIEVALPDTAARQDIFGRVIGRIVMEHEEPPQRIFADGLDLGELAEASPGLAGADINEVIRRATFTKAREALAKKDRGDSDSPAPISQADLLNAIQEVRREAP